MTDDIPSLSQHQKETLRGFTQRHRDETEGKISTNPILLARVIARDKPAAFIDIEAEQDTPNYDDPEACIGDICETFGLHRRRIKEVRGWSIGRSSWRLDLLPTRFVETDAFHRRRGIVYGYPPDAITDFISTTMRITSCDMVRAGFFSAEEASYLTFVSYTYHNSLKRFEELIEEGKDIRDRVSQLRAAWDLPILDEYADDLYADAVAAYRGEGFSLMTMFPPEQNVSKNDVARLLAD